MKIILTIALAAVLAGCATTGPVPQSLLTCAEQPVAPVAELQRDVALYIVDLAEAGADCRSKLGAMRRILEPTQ